MSRVVFAISVLFASLALSLNSCVKNFDSEVKEPCRILEFTYYEKYPQWGYYDTVVAKFFYDHRGNPTSIIYNGTTTGRPNLFFKYDSKGRLVEFYGLYPGAKGFDFYQIPIYDDNNVIVADSFYISGSDTTDRLWYTQNVFLGKYEYDSKGRIIRYDYDIYFPMNPAFGLRHDEVRYSYDERGNKIDTRFVYDDKKNFLSTHPILQFINRDYSVNNPIQALSYNRFGLPLTYDSALSHPYNHLRFLNTGAQYIVYSCD